MFLHVLHTWQQESSRQQVYWRLNTTARMGKPLEICGVSARPFEQWHTAICKDHFWSTMSHRTHIFYTGLDLLWGWCNCGLVYRYFSSRVYYFPPRSSVRAFHSWKKKYSNSELESRNPDLRFLGGRRLHETHTSWAVSLFYSNISGLWDCSSSKTEMAKKLLPEQIILKVWSYIFGELSVSGRRRYLRRARRRSWDEECNSWLRTFLRQIPLLDF